MEKGSKNVIIEARVLRQNTAVGEFPVVKMALKILRMEMCAIRFRIVCSSLYAVMESSVVISNTTLGVSYVGKLNC